MSLVQLQVNYVPKDEIRLIDPSLCTFVNINSLEDVEILNKKSCVTKASVQIRRPFELAAHAWRSVVFFASRVAVGALRLESHRKAPCR